MVIRVLTSLANSTKARSDEALQPRPTRSEAESRPRLSFSVRPQPLTCRRTVHLEADP